MSADLGQALESDSVGERVRFDIELQCLVGGRCGTCNAEAWPRRAVCWRCGSADVEPAALDREGTLVTCSRVWIPAEGLEPPYTVGLIRLGSDVSVFAHVRGLDDEDRMPMTVTTQVDSDGHPTFWFEPIR